MAENNPLNPSVFKYTDKIKWEQVYKIISEFNSEIFKSKWGELYIVHSTYSKKNE